MIWFTADTHFFHKKIPLYTKRRFCLNREEKKQLDSIWSRGGPTCTQWGNWCPSWESINKMNDALINNINNCVKANDVLWHLGDFCYAPKNKVDDFAKSIFDRINCKNIYLLKGNHDFEIIFKYFQDCFERKEIRNNRKLLILSHYAQLIWNKSHEGSWMLYGHSHATAEKFLDEMMPDRLSLDVGVDNVNRLLGEYRPISFDEINKIFKHKGGNSIDTSLNLL